MVFIHLILGIASSTICQMTAKIFGTVENLIDAQKFTEAMANSAHVEKMVLQITLLPVGHRGHKMFDVEKRLGLLQWYHRVADTRAAMALNEPIRCTRRLVGR